MTESKPADKGRVLVVDDDDTLRDYVDLALTDEGYSVRTASNGKEALDQVNRCQPGLILLDMRMPVLDGWEFARLYRQRPARHAPICVLTAAADAAKRAAEVQADAYLPKPFDLNQLYSVVEKYVGRARPR